MDAGIELTRAWPPSAAFKNKCFNQKRRVSASKQQIEAIFFAAVNMPDDAQQRAFLERACAGDPQLSAAVKKLLANHAATEDFFASTHASLTLTAADIQEAVEGGIIENCSDVDERIGSKIGRYKLVRRIGEGGWGVVFMAEQDEPIHRRIALKIIRAGADNENVFDRFQTECRALAMMDHPCIARVLDAGRTITGRPYFVMELAGGLKITEFCDRENLPLRDRIALFIQICQAVQHAHHKGIIHRDLKPSNILVAAHDGMPMPKIIDFGIAKAIEGQGGKAMPAAGAEQMMGTPAYMSPEQAGIGALDVDTRSDVYSLGVLLYELLTGRTPFEPKKGGGELQQMRRSFLESEPQSPSRLLAMLAPAESRTIAHRRCLEPGRLISTVEGDLDCIVMKALERDRTRRYDTADALATDMLRYAKNEPVAAHPPDRLYRLRKLIVRNKVVFAAGALMVAVLVLALGLVIRSLARERDARREQAHLRLEAEAARSDEARLRRQAEARDQLRHVAALVAQNDLTEADALFAQIPLDGIEPSQESVEVLRTLGGYYACAGRWRQAADCFTTLVRVNRLRLSQRAPSGLDGMDLLFAGSAMVECGDVSGYDHFRQDALERFATCTNSVVAERIVKATLLTAPDENTCKLLEPLAESLKRSVASFDTQTDRETRNWQILALVLFEYRRGGFTNALQYWQEYSKSHDANLARLSAIQSIVAMSDQGLGQNDLALAKLAEARKQVEARFSQPLREGYFPDGSWCAWLIARQLEMEAATLIDGTLESGESAAAVDNHQ